MGDVRESTVLPPQERAFDNQPGSLSNYYRQNGCENGLSQRLPLQTGYVVHTAYSGSREQVDEVHGVADGTYKLQCPLTQQPAQPPLTLGAQDE